MEEWEECIVCGRKLTEKDKEKFEDICYRCGPVFKWKRDWNDKGEKDGLAYLRAMQKKRRKWIKQNQS